MTGMGEPAVTGAGNQMELGTGEELGTDQKLEGQQEEHCPREETAEQRRQRRLLRELALRALI